MNSTDEMSFDSVKWEKNILILLLYYVVSIIVLFLLTKQLLTSGESCDGEKKTVMKTARTK